jgi:LysM repeat protein
VTRVCSGLAIAVAVAALAASQAHADATNDTAIYRVRSGDTLDLVAAEYYGDHNDAVFIMVENKMQHARKLVPGEKLKIPISREITTSPGDTLGTLAQAFLGDSRRAWALADFNNLAIGAGDTIAAGTQLTIPFHVTHVAAATETVASIAAAYFGDARQGDMLRRYNALERASIDKGESIVVPIFHVRVRTSKLPPIDADSKARREHQRSAAAALAEVIPRARAAWIQGDFAGVKAALATVQADLDYLDTGGAVEVGLLLGKAYAAFDENELAVASFGRVHARDPKLALSRYADSPKIVVLWEKAGGRVAP